MSYTIGAVVVGQDGKWHRPQKIGAEHSVNVTIDPIVSMSGEKYATQIIFKGEQQSNKCKLMLLRRASGHIYDLSRISQRDGVCDSERLANDCNFQRAHREI